MLLKFAFFVFLTFLHLSHSTYILKVRLVEFSNPRKRLQDLSCCDKSFGKCTDCDTLVEFCISTKISLQTTADCDVHRSLLKEYPDTSTVRFPAKSGEGVFQFKIRKRFEGHISFMFLIYDVDVLQNELINNFKKKNFLFAATNISKAVELTMPRLVGKQGSSMIYTLTAYCDKHYYGSDCSTYCREDDPEDVGNFRCTEKGDKICKDGYFGPDCTKRTQPTTAAATTTTTASTEYPTSTRKPMTDLPTNGPAPVCGGNITASSGNITVTARDYKGVLKKPTLLKCSWKIHVPRGQMTRIYFTEFNIHRPMRCIDTIITIEMMDQVLTFYCSDIPPSSGEVRLKESVFEVHAVISFDTWSEDSGFQLVYEAM